MQNQLVALIVQASNTIIPILGKQVLYSTILFLIILPMTRVLKHRSPYWHLGIWSILLLRLLLPPDLSYQWSARNVLNCFSVHRHSDLGDDSDMQTNVSGYRSHSSALSHDASRPGYIVLFFLWVSGVLVCLGRYLRQVLKYHLLIKRATPIQDAAITDILQCYRSRFGIKRSIRLVTSNQHASPFTLGLFRPYIVLPERIVQSQDMAVLQTILAHETVHIKRWDALWITIHHLLQIVYFFHPVVWYALSQLSVSRECICDMWAIAGCEISPRVYGRNLLIILKAQVADNNVALFPSFSSQYKAMRYRIQHLMILKESIINQQRSCIMRILRVTVVSIFLLLFGGFFLPMASSVAQNSASEKFVLPVKDGHITAKFGPMTRPVTGQKRTHQGIDIAARIGTKVYAAADGTVVLAVAQVADAYGKNIILQHVKGYTTRYAKLSEVLVKKGQAVKAGELIGRVGNTGVSTGPHLHFEILNNGTYEDPETYIDFKKLGASE